MEIVDTQQQQMTDTVATGFFMPMELNDHTPDEIVVFQSLALAERWRTFKNFFDENKHWLVELKKRMGARQGVVGKKFLFNGVHLSWTEFVQHYMKVTPAYMRMLLGEKPEPKEDDGEKPEKKVYTQTQFEEAVEKAYEEGVEAARDAQDEAEDEEAEDAVLTQGEKDHIATMPSRKAAIIADEIFQTLSTDRGMNSYDIGEVIGELQKLNKPSAKPQPTRFDQATAHAV
jgi:hypothetical protein